MGFTTAGTVRIASAAGYISVLRLRSGDNSVVCVLGAPALVVDGIIGMQQQASTTASDRVGWSSTMSSTITAQAAPAAANSANSRVVSAAAIESLQPLAQPLNCRLGASWRLQLSIPSLLLLQQQVAKHQSRASDVNSSRA